MKVWLRVILQAVGTGLAWAAVWAAVGALIGRAGAGGALNGNWVGPPIGMQPGFVSGVLFSALLGIVARPRRFDELPLLIVIACGAMIGFVIGMLPLAINQLPRESSPCLVAAVVIGSMTLMGSASAAGALGLARLARGMAR